MIISETDFKKQYMGTWDVARNKIKVLMLYIVYPLAMASYFRKALEHRDDVELIVAGPYTGSWIPWMGGMNVLEKYDNPPDIPLPYSGSSRVDYGIIKAQLPHGWKPDVVLCVDAGINWSERPTDGVVVTVGTDPHVLDYDHARKISDKFFNMQAVYSKHNDIYLPYAYSQYDHYPEERHIGSSTDVRGYKSIEKDTDAVLIGMPYENRIKWVEELRKRGVSVIFENGPVYDEARELYNRGRIGLNWSSMEDLNARAFELSAMKLYPVMNRVPDMSQFPHIFDYCGIFENNLQDAIERVLWAKDHPEQTSHFTNRAHLAVQPETYDARVSQILRECRLA